jgi:hypothetical protein
LTTTQSGFPQEQEISVIFIRDAIAKALRSGFAGFIGNVGSSQSLTNMIARGQALFKSFISQQLITSYTNLVIVQDPIEPRQFDVTATIVPVFPINWVYALVDVGTSVTA